MTAPVPTSAWRFARLVVGSGLLAATCGLVLAQPAIAAPITMSQEDLEAHCRSKGGTFYKDVKSGEYTCSLKGGSVISCTKEGQCSMPPQRNPVQAEPPVPDANAPDDPVQVTPGPIIKPGNGNAG